MRLQAENAKSKTATDSRLQNNMKNTLRIENMITSATERNKMVTQKLQKSNNMLKKRSRSECVAYN